MIQTKLEASLMTLLFIFSKETGNRKLMRITNKFMKVFKWKHNLSPKLMDHIFKTKKAKYSLRKFTNMEVGSVKTTAYTLLEQ